MLLLALLSLAACGLATTPPCWYDAPMSRAAVTKLLGGPGNVGPVTLTPAM